MNTMSPQAIFNKRFAYYLHTTVNLLDAVADRSLKAQTSMSLSQFLVLLAIHDARGATSQQMLAKHLAINKAAISRHGATLEHRGLLVRSRVDGSGRKYTLSLTSKGEEALADARVVLEATMSEHYLAPGDPGAQATLDGLVAIHDSLVTRQ